jgi:hypothetical protein
MPGRLGGKVGAEGLPFLVAVSAGAETAGDSDLAQVSGDSPGWLTLHLAETVEAVAAASPTRRPEMCGTDRSSRTELPVGTAVLVALELPCREAGMWI